MSDITEDQVRRVVQGELRNLESDIKRTLSSIESKIHEIHSIHSDVLQTVQDISRLVRQTQDVPQLSQTLNQIEATVRDLRSRMQRAEESSRYTAGYVAMRLKERYDRGLD